MSMLRIAIITGSTRPKRINEAVAKWVYQVAKERKDIHIELVDIVDYKLPLLDEPKSPSLGQYIKPHTKAWSKKIRMFDGYIFVTPEYNHGISGALKNAIDFLFQEWHNKAASFVSYGSAGGARAVEQLRLVMAEVMVATVRAQVLLSLATDFKNFRHFDPDPIHVGEIHKMVDQLILWSSALKTVRLTPSELVHQIDKNTQGILVTERGVQ